MAEKPTIAWDVDDVLAVTMPRIVASINDRFDRQLAVTDFTEDFCAMTGVSPDETSEWWLQFCRTEFPLLQPAAGMRSLLENIQFRATHRQLTSRRPEFRDVTESWTARHYPGLIDELHIAGIPWADDPRAHQRTKVNDVIAIRADCLVDDQKKHALGVAEAGRIGVRYCDLQFASSADELAAYPPTYFEVYTITQLSEVLSNTVLSSH